jgi:hypothetical protein
VEEPERDDNKVSFSVLLSTDRDHFLRRTCPSCGRDFKTEIDKADLASVIAPQIRRMGFDMGGGDTGESEESDEPLLYCPYCEYKVESSKTLTQETVDYLHRHLMREVVLPMVDKAFAPLASMGSSSGGLLSISFEYHRSFLPPRPIHGPEPPDMKIIDFKCCNKRAKVADGWNGVRVCVFCGVAVTLM